MKAMILAAGLGERLRPLTLLRAKPVLPVLNRPLLHWTLERLARQGVTDVVVNLHHLPGTVRRALGDGRALGLRLRYSFEPEILGTGGGPRRVRRFFGDEPFLIVNGDVLFDFDVRRLFREHRRSGAVATLAVRRNPDPRRYSGLVLEGGWLKRVALPPAPPRSWLFAGVHVMEPRLLERLPDGPSDSVRHLYMPLIAEGGRVRGVVTRGTWYDFGGPALYRDSQMSLLAHGFRAFRSRSKLVDPTARIAKGARVEGSVIGPGCVLEAGARVTRSILWDNVHVGRDATVEDAVVASRVSVPAGAHERGVVLVRQSGVFTRSEI